MQFGLRPHLVGSHLPISVGCCSPKTYRPDLPLNGPCPWPLCPWAFFIFPVPHLLTGQLVYSLRALPGAPVTLLCPLWPPGAPPSIFFLLPVLLPSPPIPAVGPGPALVPALRHAIGITGLRRVLARLPSSRLPPLVPGQFDFSAGRPRGFRSVCLTQASPSLRPPIIQPFPVVFAYAPEGAVAVTVTALTDVLSTQNSYVHPTGTNPYPSFNSMVRGH